MTLLTTPQQETQIQDLISQMTLAEKVGQMTQVEKNSIQPAHVTAYFIGSILSGGGGNPVMNDAANWRTMVQSFAEAALQTRLKIPLIYGVDAVHGHNNVHGATVFPHNIGLGAARDTQLVERVGQIVAKEILATGVHWDFAPAVSVPQDVRWGRTYEGFSEDTALVSELGAAFVRGLQSDLGYGVRALASVKHYLGDGGTTWGTTNTPEWIPPFMWRALEPNGKWSIDQGDCQVDEATLRAVHLAPYRAAIAEGALNIMISYNMWHRVRLHGHQYLLTDVLKGELGFQGFLVSDWMAINPISPDYYTCVVTAFNAGLDMMMVPFDYQTFIVTLTQAVEQGDVPLTRIDDAVRRILRAKFAIGLFEQPLTDAAWLEAFGSEEHRAVAREAVQKSLVLLKNENSALPLPKDTRLLVIAGAGADDIGLACGGWTLEWQGKVGRENIGKSLLDGLKASDNIDTTMVYDVAANFPAGIHAPIGIVVLAEPPYAEGEGDRPDLSLTADEIALIHKTRAACDKLVLILYAGRPLVITEAISLCDAIVMAWLPGTEADAIADVLTGDVPFTGKLSYALPRNMSQVPRSALLASDEPPLYPFGYGLTLA